MNSGSERESFADFVQPCTQPSPLSNAKAKSFLFGESVRIMHVMQNTADNLKVAFAGESQASQKYLAFAKQAEKEGFPHIATLFRTAAEAERIHAEGHFGAMDGIGSTADNLASAIEGETYEYTKMYPPMIKQAETDGHKAKRMFAYASKAEAIHARLYKLALETAKKGQDLPEGKIYLCPVCGHIEIGAAPDTCPICKAKGSTYVQVGQ